MRTRRRELGRLGARFLLALMTASLVWVALGPFYERGLTAVSLALLHAIEPQPMTATARVESPYAFVAPTDAFRSLGEQRLDLATIHDNVPLLVALFLASPGLTRRRRLGGLAVAAVVLAATHVLHFALSVQWRYALENVGPYRVVELDYLTRGFWRSLDHHGQTAKYLITPLYDFYNRIGRLFMPIVLWMIAAPIAWSRGRP